MALVHPLLALLSLLLLFLLFLSFGVLLLLLFAAAIVAAVAIAACDRHVAGVSWPHAAVWRRRVGGIAAAEGRRASAGVGNGAIVRAAQGRGREGGAAGHPTWQRRRGG